MGMDWGGGVLRVGTDVPSVLHRVPSHGQRLCVVLNKRIIRCFYT